MHYAIVWNGEGSITVVKAAQVIPTNAPLNTECEVVDGKNVYKGMAVGRGEFTHFKNLFIYNELFRPIGNKSDMLQLESNFLEGKWHPFPCGGTSWPLTLPLRKPWMN